MDTETIVITTFVKFLWDMILSMARMGPEEANWQL